jgi:hypothetical protein
MGIDVYALRAPAQTLRTGSTASTHPGPLPSATQLVVVCAHGVRGAAHLTRLFAQLPQTLGIASAAVAWLEADVHGALAAPPGAPAYLVLGADMARALGVHLSTMQQNTSAIAVTSEPSRLPGSAMEKRALWQVLKPLARQLRAARS